MVLEFHCALGSPGELGKTGRWASLPKFPIDLGRGLKICISNKLHVKLMLLVQEPHFENHEAK